MIWQVYKLKSVHNQKFQNSNKHNIPVNLQSKRDLFSDEKEKHEYPCCELILTYEIGL